MGKQQTKNKGVGVDLLLNALGLSARCEAHHGLDFLGSLPVLVRQEHLSLQS
jgi:hypothetical protein